MATSQMDGLFITGNLVQMRDGAPYGAIQVQHGGLRNVLITNNVLRTTSGSGKARAIGALRAATHIVVAGNVCDPGMTTEIPAHALCYDNYDFLGNSMPGLAGCRGRPAKGGL